MRPPSRVTGRRSSNVEWLVVFTEFAATKRGMRDALRSTPLGEGIDDNYVAVQARIADGIAPILAAGVTEGTIRPDAQAADVVLLVAGSPVPHDIGREQSQRVLGLVLDALRPEPERA